MRRKKEGKDEKKERNIGNWRRREGGVRRGNKRGGIFKI